MKCLYLDASVDDGYNRHKLSVLTCLHTNLDLYCMTLHSRAHDGIECMYHLPVIKRVKTVYFCNTEKQRSKQKKKIRDDEESISTTAYIILKSQSHIIYTLKRYSTF